MAGYELLRRENARVVLDRIANLRPVSGARVLDVGSAYGWFLEEAERAGASSVGIEPDERVAARSYGEVRIGRFPDALVADECFDVIAFNDVLEHIPDVRGALEACRASLRPGGLLSVNIPTADGLAFRAAEVLARFGVRGPYERLWQRGLASPHLHYFSTAALVNLLGSCGIRVRRVDQLSAIGRDGLWQRLHTVRPVGPTSLVSYACLYAAAGLLNRPGCSDIVHVIGERALD
ncbi:MAG: methyltransferase [Solirubrobacterales bacterium]|nr:methyltransferase [Solirubrobacterales bacterium]